MFVLFTQPIRARLCTALCCCSKCGEDGQHLRDDHRRQQPGQDPSAQGEDDGVSRTDRWCYIQRKWGLTKVDVNGAVEYSTSRWASLHEVPGSYTSLSHAGKVNMSARWSIRIMLPGCTVECLRQNMLQNTGSILDICTVKTLYLSCHIIYLSCAFTFLGFHCDMSLFSPCSTGYSSVVFIEK